MCIRDRPQTVEAIHHAKAAKVPIIVAINKMDKPDAKPERVRTDLLQHEIQVESMGGDVVDVEVSATKKTNIDKLLEMIGLQAEILDLKANQERPAEGTVIEAKLDRGRGPVATVLIQRGTLRVGDLVVAGAEWGRVRALVSDTGEPIESAGPSTPVEVLGFSGTPDAGDRLAVVENEGRAREVADYRGRQKREKSSARATGMRGSLEQMMAQAKTSGRKEFPLVIKADVQGSLEAVIGSLDKLGTDEVAARVLHAGVGGISESDVTLAEASGVPIIAFNVRANKEAREAAERAGIEIRYYNIIYDLVDDVKKVMSGLLPPTLRETMLGNAQILEIFKVSKVGNIAGCRVTDGTVERGANVRLIRDNVVIHEGKLSQLKRFKDDAKEVSAGMECGMAFEGYQDMRQGDVIECYRVETINAACGSKSHGFARSLVPPFPRHDVNARHKPWHDKSHWIAMTRKKGHRDSGTPGGSQRQLRVGELVRHAMADMLTRGDVHDPVIEGHLITVPEVRMAPDLRLATIYIMPLAGRDADEVLAAFERHKKFLRGAIAHRVNLKFAPDIRFRVDERFEEAERIDKLLRSPAVKRDLEHEDDE